MDGDICSCLASCMKIGSITTTKGVLFTKAEASVTPRPKVTKVKAGCASALRAASWPTVSKTPVRTRAPTMMNIAAIVQGALFDRTEPTLSIGKMPRISISVAPPIATTSTA